RPPGGRQPEPQGRLAARAPRVAIRACRHCQRLGRVVGRLTAHRSRRDLERAPERRTDAAGPRAGAGRGGGVPATRGVRRTAPVVAAGGVTYAEYARRGFFELVTASALVLPLLTGADWLLRNEPAAHQRTFRQLAIVLLLLLAAVMASALERMRLYVSAYGLS